MKYNDYNWGIKKHDRTLNSKSTYLFTKMAFYIAPNMTSRLMREKGFSIKPYRLSEDQHDLMSQAQSFFLEFNDNKIKVFEWGYGPVILLIHGWGGRALQMNNFIEAFVNKGYKVVAFDHKGHGDSSSNFSSYPEIVRSTTLVTEHYAADLYGVIAHSIGSNAMFKVSEHFDHELKLASIAPVENFIAVLEKMRMKLGIYEKLFARLVSLIEADSQLYLADLNVLDYEKIKRHDVLLVHDKFDRINNIRSSYEIQNKLNNVDLLTTERLGHSRILGNQEVLEQVVTHFTSPHS